MTKTEQILLRRGAENPQQVVAVCYGHISGRRTGRSSYGRRELGAAKKLVAKGLFTFVVVRGGVRQLCHGFGADYGSQAVFKLTERGMALVGRVATPS